MVVYLEFSGLAVSGGFDEEMEKFSMVLFPLISPRSDLKLFPEKWINKKF